MKVPNLSNLMNVCQLRYLQSVWEEGELQNPDYCVGMFLTLRERARCLIQGRRHLSEIRALPFYPYVLARTKYYDDVFLRAIYAPCALMLNIGCGTDTRALRFSHLLRRRSIRVAEFDQEAAIETKKRIVGEVYPRSQVEYRTLDLNRQAWPEIDSVLKSALGSRVFVMLEGVSPYVGSDSFREFLRLLSARLGPGSEVVYDFKIEGFGIKPEQDVSLFRLPAHEESVAAFHRSVGFDLTYYQLAKHLTLEYLPNSKIAFDEDVVVQLEPLNPR